MSTSCPKADLSCSEMSMLDTQVGSKAPSLGLKQPTSGEWGRFKTWIYLGIIWGQLWEIQSPTPTQGLLSRLCVEG